MYFNFVFENKINVSEISSVLSDTNFIESVTKKDTVWTVYKENVKASCYGWYFHGRKTACGETFDQWGSTVAHNQLKCGTVIRVTSLKTGLSEICRVTDTGGFNKLGRNIDLSRGIMKRISGKEINLIRVKIEVMEIK